VLWPGLEHGTPEQKQVPESQSFVHLQVMTTAAGVFGIIVSQAIGAVLVDMYFLVPFLALSRRKWGHSVEDGSNGVWN